MAHCAHIPAFVLHQVTCQFATGQTLFGPLSVSLEPSLCGLVGRNGVGKTRLLRLLAGLDSPAGGHIERAAAVTWVAQQPTLTPETTLATLLGYASVFAALSRLEQGQGLADDFDLLDGHWDLTDRLSLAFREADLPPFSADRPAFSLSGGERMKALLCGAFVSGTDYLLLDEPTNHLDRQGREWLYHQLESWQGGALIASHDRELLTRMPRIIELTPTALRSYGGNYDEYQRQRMAEQQAARAALEHAVTDRRRTRARMQKEHDAAQRRSAQTLRTVDTLNIASFERVKYKGAAKERPGALRRQHREQNSSLNAAVQQARERIEDDNPVMFTLPGSEVAAGKQVLVVESLQLDHAPAAPLNWRIDGPMRIALKGPNGCGKTTLLKTLLGLEQAASGDVRLSVSAAYLDQHLTQLDLSLSVMAHLSLEDTPLDEGLLRTRLAQIQLGADKVTLPLSALSGGERLKAALACVLLRREPAQLLLLDEPTNHLDLASTQAIESALAAFPGAMLVVSHDEAFLQGLKLTHSLAWRETGWHFSLL
ncbi:ATP-binding cassette domain-containing protein [Klebsiella pneumoniae]|uniref:ATP-binding cassette domain-containing protein n=1 Tax=Klebsiella pneumoniae TaxID=573 RepID=UPI000C7AEBD1|nr:ATP-binding cassette domain-containing protein [Klebsiella pneumoniae]MBD0936120.1 ABC-F family ATP-binding cassette domain-containing protein [Klebsiella pneumoniae]MCA4971653.1 ATP-binding cassette domain-containing protein [Klebsiella pneumoniae]MCA5020152.1 ATP-binding cassette domain-containing protein [Klebsiella pneumoniae]MCA5024847.1 ATP-binding cassette domain-containing protein [Klebsiella pneumoniae]MCA5030469.1 ATP-binding cassette domain-containing protein [Klebsiella pneumoni